jgi:membrane protein required for colicin V production
VNWVDLILVVVLALFGLRGFFRGLFREFFSTAGLILGFILAVSFAGVAAAYAGSLWGFSPLMLKGAAFVVIFFIAYFCLSITGWLLHRSEKMLFLKTVNRTGGIAIGVSKGAALTALAVFFLSQATWLPHSTRDNFAGSYLVTPLSRLAESLIRVGKGRIFSGESSERASSPNFHRL